MISPREQAEKAIAGVEDEISKMLKNGDMTQEDLNDLFARISSN